MSGFKVRGGYTPSENSIRTLPSVVATTGTQHNFVKWTSANTHIDSGFSESSTGTFNYGNLSIANATSTGVHFGANAQSVNIGSSTGTTSLHMSCSGANIIRATSTGVHFGENAQSVNIGSSTGTTSIHIDALRSTGSSINIGQTVESVNIAYTSTGTSYVRLCSSTGTSSLIIGTSTITINGIPLSYTLASSVISNPTGYRLLTMPYP
jgi:hypothetical protein